MDVKQIRIKDLVGSYRVIRHSVKNSRVQAVDSEAMSVMGFDSFLVETDRIYEVDLKPTPVNVLPRVLSYSPPNTPKPTSHDDLIGQITLLWDQNQATVEDLLEMIFFYQELTDSVLINQMKEFRKSFSAETTLNHFIEALITNSPLED